MAKKQDEAVEVKEYGVIGTVNIKGVTYSAGEKVVLTEEEYVACVAAGAPVEGVEPKTEEEAQAAHEEGVEAQKKRIEEGPPKTEEETA